MSLETILQHEILANFALPFLLVFFIVFAILEKTEVFGKERTQLNALSAFVMGLIFVSAVFPKQVVSNLVLFFTVAVVVVFIVLLLWGFITGGTLKEKILEEKGLKWVIGIVLVIAVVFAVVWATGKSEDIYEMLFKQDWSSTFWTTLIFIALAAGALAWMIKEQK